MKLALLTLLLLGCSTVPKPNQRINMPAANPACLIGCRVHVETHEGVPATPQTRPTKTPEN